MRSFVADIVKKVPKLTATIDRSYMPVEIKRAANAIGCGRYGLACESAGLLSMS